MYLVIEQRNSPRSASSYLRSHFRCSLPARLRLEIGAGNKSQDLPFVICGLVAIGAGFAGMRRRRRHEPRRHGRAHDGRDYNRNDSTRYHSYGAGAASCNSAARTADHHSGRHQGSDVIIDQGLRPHRRRYEQYQQGGGIPVPPGVPVRRRVWVEGCVPRILRSYAGLDRAPGGGGVDTAVAGDGPDRFR